MRITRILFTISLSLMLITLLAACHTSKSYSFQIENGDKIKITLDTSDGYQLAQEDGVFTIVKDDQSILTGCFLTSDGYEEKVATVLASDLADMISATPEDAPTSYFYQFEGEAGTETDFLFSIEGTETGAIVGSLSPRAEAEAAFALLQFEKVS